MTRLTEKTWVPISLVGAIVGIIVSLVVTITNLSAKTGQNEKEIEEIKAGRAEGRRDYNKTLLELRQDVSEIKGMLNVVLNKGK